MDGGGCTPAGARAGAAGPGAADRGATGPLIATAGVPGGGPNGLAGAGAPDGGAAAGAEAGLGDTGLLGSGATGFGFVKGLAFDSSSGLLLATDRITDQLISIDTTTGAGSAIGPFLFAEIASLAFDPSAALCIDCASKDEGG